VNDKGNVIDKIVLCESSTNDNTNVHNDRRYNKKNIEPQQSVELLEKKNENGYLFVNYYTLSNDAKFHPIMVKKKDQNNRVCIVGASGSGKTTFAANMMKQYRDDNKKKEIFLFTRNKEDKSIDNVANPTRIELDEEELLDSLETGEPYIDIEWLKKSCCIFDDIEQTSKLLTKYLTSLRMDAITNGRKLDIDIISIIHNTDFRNTRLVFSEMSMLTLFMKSSQAMNKRILKDYVGLNIRQIEELKKINSRWICIRTIYPMMVMWETGIAFI
jgi:energy-coupling factor transporter ATP-binding protein EcfA2